MVKVYLWGWYSSELQPVIQRLIDNNICQFVNPKMSLSPDILDTIIHKPYLLDISQNHRVQITEKQLDKLNDYKVVFFETYSRVRASAGHSYQEMDNLFWLYVNFFLSELDHSRPDKVFFNSPPHYGADVVLYAAAKILRIKTKIFIQTLFPSRFFCVSEYEDIGQLNVLPAVSDIDFDITKFIKKELFYMKGFKTPSQNCLLALLKNFLIKPYSKKTLKRSAALQIYNDCVSYKKASRDLLCTNVDLNAKFVYFPLQLQPEMTTSLLGGKLYANQMNALDVLLRILPNDWLIYVKENPKQLYTQRGKLFLERLGLDKRVKYVDKNVNSFELIEKSQFVSVVTGTAGWEALLLNKPVLSFGYAWFNPLGGVTKFKDFIDIDTLVNSTVGVKQLELDFNQLLQRSYDGVIDPVYSAIVDNYSTEINQAKVYDVLKNVILDIT